MTFNLTAGAQGPAGPAGGITEPFTFTDAVRSTYDSEAAIPASASAGFAITSNYAGFGEVDYFSLVNSAGGLQGHYFYQKTAAGTVNYIGQFSGNAAFSYLELLGAGIYFSAYVDATIVNFGSSGAVPMAFSTQTSPRFIMAHDGAENASIVPLQWYNKVTTKTADFAPSGTIDSTTQDFGVHYKTTGAVATVIATLPSSAVNGWNDTFTVDAAQILRIQCPASHTISIGAATSAAAGKAEASADAVLGYFLNQTLSRMIATAKRHEKEVIGVEDIPVT